MKNEIWDQFHSPKNLAMNLQVEAAEVAEHFVWLTRKNKAISYSYSKAKRCR